MDATFFIKLMISVFLLNILFFLGTRYIYLVFRRIPEHELGLFFRKMWIYGFFISLDVFCLILIWFPTLFHDNFFSNPIPTLIFVLIASLIFATVGAISARQPSSSVVLLKKIRDEIDKDSQKNDS